jgi:CofD-related protein of GAK system
MVQQVKLTHFVNVPDKVKVARYHRIPELGPKILFFSGGSALRRLSRLLTGYTHNSIHLITPFDSGGSSAELRKAFAMPAIGDVRNRMMALCDRSIPGNLDIYRLFSFRFPQGQVKREYLQDKLYSITFGDDPLISVILQPMQDIIRNNLRIFYEKMPTDFDLKGASIGNLILAGGYLNNQHQMNPVIFLFSKLLEVRGIVQPITTENHHLRALLEDGTELLGQHLITGRDIRSACSPIKNLSLSSDMEKFSPSTVQVCKQVSKLIRQADLICYPMGSFYSSIIANLLPMGIGEAVASNGCPKVYIPNMGQDPEQYGASVYELMEKLIAQLQKTSTTSDVHIKRFLNFVVIDSKKGFYPRPFYKRKIRQLGVHIIDTQLITEKSHPYLDEMSLVEVLLSLSR